MSRESNTTVQVAISNPRSANGEKWVEVRISDGPSGMPLADFRMDPADWYDLLHGGIRSDVPAFVTTHVDRIGKHYEAETVPAPEDWRWARDLEPGELIAATPTPEGWDGYDHARVNKTNRGPSVTFMRWVDASGADQ